MAGRLESPLEDYCERDPHARALFWRCYFCVLLAVAITLILLF